MRSKQAEHSTDFAAREEVGSGLKAGMNEDIGAPMSQKSHRMRQTDYSRGFMSNLDMGNANVEMDHNKVLKHRQAGIDVGGDEPGSPSKVFRSWSRPQIMTGEMVDMAHGDLNSEHRGLAG